MPSSNTTPNDSTGDFELAWTLQGGTLRGTITIDGSPCLDGGEITGVLTFDQIDFGVVSGQVEVAYTGTVDQNGKSMAGTYATSCGDAQGTWEATKEP